MFNVVVARVHFVYDGDNYLVQCIIIRFIVVTVARLDLNVRN